MALGCPVLKHQWCSPKHREEAEATPQSPAQISSLLESFQASWDLPFLGKLLIPPLPTSLLGSIFPGPTIKLSWVTIKLIATYFSAFVCSQPSLSTYYVPAMVDPMVSTGRREPLGQGVSQNICASALRRAWARGTYSMCRVDEGMPPRVLLANVFPATKSFPKLALPLHTHLSCTSVQFWPKWHFPWEDFGQSTLRDSWSKLAHTCLPRRMLAPQGQD